jgi:zinc/manganese transport system ATP-binding protein
MVGESAPEVSAPTAPAAPPDVEPVVALSAATVLRGGRPVWHDVSLEVRPGEFLAILGPNGSGKSTLLKAILGLLPLAEGSVSVLGSAARRGNPAIGYLPQRRHFDADVRVRGRDIVRLGLDGNAWGPHIPWLHGARDRERRRRVAEVIEQVGASSYADRPIGELSGGEQQRLLIAQALVTRPRLLALDEPLESLDLRNQQGVAGVIRQVSRETGAAVLLVAHDVNPILSALDRVVYIARGRVAVGTPEEVITTETLSRLYNTPIEVLRASDGQIVVVGQAEEEISDHASQPR